MKALVFNIKRGAFEDGPGVRTTIFLKGCPLRCVWCCNPEGQRTRPELGPQQESREFSERYYSLDDLLELVLRDKAFYDRSGGGVTIGGGEPTFQPEFTYEFIRRCKARGVHVAVDTCGYVTKTEGLKILETADILLYDLKHIDPEEHRVVTGKTNAPILKNIERMIARGKPIIIRIPVIPRYTDSKGNIENIGEYLASFNASCIKRIDLLPFHNYATSKYKTLGKKYELARLKPPSVERMKQLEQFFHGVGFRVQIGG